VVYWLNESSRWGSTATRGCRGSPSGSAGATWLEVRESAQARFTAEIQRRLAKGVWSTGGCTNWYLDAKGVNRTIWPGQTWRYWLATRAVRPTDFELITAADTLARRGGDVEHTVRDTAEAGVVGAGRRA
jgi:hypothetical protein